MNTTAPLLGLIGKKRSGKDTFAATLVEDLGYVRVAFADPLKEVALAINPIVDVDLGAPEYLADIVAAHGWEDAKGYGDVRRFLQELGVAIRTLDPDFWLNIAKARIEALDSETPVVITDVRFPNEAEAVVELGGDVVRIVRPSIVSTDTHASETALDDYPEMVSIMNEGTLSELADAAYFVHNFASTSF